MTSKNSTARLGPDPWASVAALRDLGLSDEEIARYFVTTSQEIQSFGQRDCEAPPEHVLLTVEGTFPPGRPKTDPDPTDDMYPTRTISD